MSTEILCFVGRLPKRQATRYLRSSIREALAEYGFLTWQFADDLSTAPDTFERLCSLIDRAAFCIFEVSGVRMSNAFLEVGYALGQGKHCVLLLHRGDRCPADLAASEKLHYSSANQLMDALRQVSIYPYVLPILGGRDRALLVVIARNLLEKGALDPSDIFEIAADHGSSEQQVLFALGDLRTLGMATEEGIDWQVTSWGRWRLSRLIDEMLSQAT